MVPAEPLGLPLVAWIGSVVFLVIFVIVLSAYL
jgi:hypothetical protein